jgi:nitronate monooxygenase
MALDPALRSRLTLPAICAPMTMVSGPALVAAACKAGVMAGLPTANAGPFERLSAWMDQISDELKRHADLHPDRPPAPLAVNLSGNKPEAETLADLELCARHGVKVFITAMGSPREKVKQVHDVGGILIHDITTVVHAEKAIAAGVDGVTCIGAGGGGHSGLMSHLVLIPKVRAMFDGVIVLAGAVTEGRAIRAAEILGADLSYLGTRFIATQESSAPDHYKQLLVGQTSDQLIYTPRISGIPANWLKESMRQNGLDPDDLPKPGPQRGYGHLPPEVRPWRTLFSAGQGIDLIQDVPSVEALVRRLRQEYVAACQIPDMAEAARLANKALDAGQ